MQMAKRLRQLRLEHNWKQDSLAERSGVSLGSLRRFETSGECSLKNLLKLCSALGRLDEFNHLLKIQTVQTMKELEALQVNKRSPGTIPATDVSLKELAVRKAELADERAKTVLDLHRKPVPGNSL
mgnify:CR=1 FL=1